MSKCYVGYMLIFLFFLWTAGPACAEQVTITGQVLGPNGEPVSDCRVFAKSHWLEEPWAEVTTGRGGGFRVVVPASPSGEDHFRVVAFKEGYAVEAKVVTAGEKAMIDLGADPVSCAGMITDAVGNPLAAATVSVDAIWFPGDDEPRIYLSELPPLTRVTDESGRFAMSGLPPNADMALAVELEGMILLVDEPYWPPTNAQDIRIALQPEASISGRVTRAGQPVPDVGVRARAGGYSRMTSSGPDGNFKSDGLPPGTYILSLDPPEGYVAIALTDIDLEAGEHYTGAELKLIEGGLIEGMVTDEETGEPISGIRIAGRGPADPSGSNSPIEAKTNESGRYELRRAPGTNQVWASLPPDRTYDRSNPREHFVQVQEGVTTTGVDFQLMRRKVINGIVRMPDDRPAAGVQMYAAPQNWGASSWPGGWEWTYTTQTDEEGRFEFIEADTFGMLVAESFGVYAFDADAGLAGFAVATDTYESVEITLAPGAHIVSRIVTQDGTPQGDVPIHFQVGPVGEDAGTRTHTLAAQPSDENGRVWVGPLPTGVPIRLLVDSDVAKWAIEPAWEKAGPVVLAPGEERQLLPLRVNLAGRTVQGSVCNQQNAPVVNAAVVATDSGAIVRTDSHGRFELSGLPTQATVEIVAIHPIEPLYTAAFVSPRRTFIRLIVEPPGGLSGQITDAKGNPIAEQEVSVSAGAPSSMEALLPQAALHQTVHTDGQGSWSVEGLVAGLYYNISALHPYYEPGVWTFARTKPGETVDLGQLSVESAEPSTIYSGPSTSP